MDPNACLAEILSSLAAIQADARNLESKDEIASKLAALAKWLRKDGFLPKVARLNDYPRAFIVGI